VKETSVTSNELIVDDLTVEYSTGGYTSRPIDGLDLHATAGSLVLLLGPSGCGKTSLLSCLAGILRPTSGTVRFAGIDVTALDNAGLTSFRRHQVGIVFQAFNLVASLTATENVMVPLRSAGIGHRAAKQRAVQALGEVELTERVDHRPGQLSGGQQQRVAIARALALDPPLVVADEPTAHLDQANLEGILRLLRRLTRDGRIVVVATHDDRLLALADQIVDLAPRYPTPAEPPAAVELIDGQVLFHAGDPSDWIYLVTHGTVEILVPRTDNGMDNVRTVTTGGWFGEMGPIFRLPRSATARAVGPTIVEPHNATSFRDRLGIASLATVIAETHVG